MSIRHALAFLLLSLSAFPSPASAHEIFVRVIVENGDRLVTRREVLVQAPISVSDLTKKVLSQDGHSFGWDKHHFEWIDDTGPSKREGPMGLERRYGWCFKVDGELPSQAPDQTMLTKSANLLWFYGYTEERPRTEWSECRGFFW